MRLTFALVLLAIGCGDDAPPGLDASVVDAGGRDANGEDGGPGVLFVSLAGADFAFVDQEICFDVRHNGGVDAAITMFWGDEARDELTGVDRACHTYAFPGEVLVSARIAARGEQTDTTRLLSVVFEPSTPRPTHASPIVYDEARDRVWVVNPDSNTVAVLEADPPSLITELPVGERPETVAIVGDRVLVTCRGDGTVRRFHADDLSSFAPVDFGAGSEPFGVAADPSAPVAWVTLAGTGELATIDPTTGSRLGVVDIGGDVRGLAVNADHVVLVTRFRSAVDGARIATVDGRDAADPVLSGLTVLPPDVDLDSDTDNSGVLSLLRQIVFSPDGGRAIIPALKANVVTGSFRTGAELTSQTTARGVLGEVMVTTPDTAGVESFRFSFDDLDYAASMVFSPEGGRIYVAFQGAESVSQLDAFAFNRTGSIDQVGFAPRGLALSPDGRLLYVQAFLSRSVRVYDVSDLSTEPEVVADVPTVAAELFDPTVLLGKQIFYRSRDPRMSRTSYLACASCHPDGEEDGLVWDFTQRGEGLRNTITLNGRGGAGHGPIHWSANFDEIQDFEHDIRGGQGGVGFLPDGLFHSGTVDTTLGDPKAGLSPELDALAAYVSSLTRFGVSPFRNEGDPGWETSFANGRTVFGSATAGCATCHSGSRFTDSAFLAPGNPTLHDVGTSGAGSGQRLGAPLSGLDTPTLRGLWRSAPYLHDGSAATLLEVLTTRNESDAHGTTSHLSSDDLDDLVVYLRCLDDLVP